MWRPSRRLLLLRDDNQGRMAKFEDNKLQRRTDRFSAVDVVVPCYNYARYLEQCVLSVLQQGVNVRVLVIDDASSDDTPTVLQRLTAMDRRVEFIRHDVNQGHIASYNEGLLQWCAAEYSLLLSADDALAPGALERASRIMDRHSAVGMVYGRARIIFDNDNAMEIAESASREDYKILEGKDFLRYCLETFRNPVPTPTAVVRTALQRKLGGYDTAFSHAGDFEMWMRFARYGSIAILPMIQGYYRRHPKNMSQQYYNQLIGDQRECVQTCEYVAALLGEYFPEPRNWMKAGFWRLGEYVYQCAGNAFDRGQMQEVRAWLDFATENSCSSYVYRAWWRLQLRRLLGQRLWQKMRPVVARRLGKPATPRQLGWAPKPGDIIGEII